MKHLKGLLAVAIAIALVAVVFASIWFTAVTPAEAAPCICPQIYAPVVCDNGKTYPNQCVADCKHAKNCVPTGAF